MTYRDDREALHAENEALHRQLRDAYQEISRLRRGDGSTPADGVEAEGATDDVAGANATTGANGAASNPWRRPPMFAAGRTSVPGSSAARPLLVMSLLVMGIGMFGLMHQGGGCPGAHARAMHTVYAPAYGALASVNDVGGLPTFVNGPVFAAPVTYPAHVMSVQGMSGLATSAQCSLTVSPVVNQAFNCHVEVRCGDNAVYGGGPAGFARCTMSESGLESANDPYLSTLDGDPMLAVSFRAGVAQVLDSSGSVTLSLDSSNVTH